MLFLKYIKLTNVGRHKKVEAHINGYVPGLAGPNGRGKSTIIQAVQFALTGTIDHPDPIRAFIKGRSKPLATGRTLWLTARTGRSSAG